MAKKDFLQLVVEYFVQYKRYLLSKGEMMANYVSL